jgi:hypothetical protein
VVPVNEWNRVRSFIRWQHSSLRRGRSVLGCSLRRR